MIPLLLLLLAGPAGPVETGPVPAPDLAGLEAEVAAQLREARGLLESLLAQAAPNPAELAETYGGLGRLYHAYDLGEAAAASYRNAGRLAPQDVRWPYLLAHLDQAAGRLDAAAAGYQRALELAPRLLPARVHLGEVELARGRPDEAERALREALAVDPGSAAARAVLGEIALSRRQYREAVDHLEAALAAVPAADRLHYPLALAYRGLGDVKKAREHLARRGTVGVSPPDAMVAELAELRAGERLPLVKGAVAFRAGRFADAAAEFRKAVTARPESATARINLAAALARSGNNAGAMEQLREAVRLAPENGTARFNLGALLATRGEDAADAEAAEHLKAAVRLDPADGEAHRVLAQVLERRGKPEAALTHWGRLVAISPLDEDARMGEANLLVSRGRYREARERLEAAHTLLPDSGRIAHGLARLLAASPDPSLRDGARAFDLAHRVAVARPTPGHLETVAMALAELGRCDEAAAWQRQALEAAGAAGQEALLPGLREALARSERGAPCRYP